MTRGISSSHVFLIEVGEEISPLYYKKNALTRQELECFSPTSDTPITGCFNITIAEFFVK